MANPPVLKWEDTFFEKFYKEPEKKKWFLKKTSSPAWSSIIVERNPSTLWSGGNYQFVTDVGLLTIFSIYCTLGKWLDVDYIINRLYILKQCLRGRKLGFDDFLTSQKSYMTLQTWRKEMPKDISEDDLSRKDISFCERSNSAKNLHVYRETFSCVSENYNASEELLSNSSRSPSPYSALQSIKWQ